MDFPRQPCLAEEIFFSLGESGKEPSRATSDSAGHDIFSSQSYKLPPNERVAINTDLFMALKPNTFGLITGRSGMALYDKTDVILGPYRSVTELMCMEVDASVIFVPVDVFQRGITVANVQMLLPVV